MAFPHLGNHIETEDFKGRKIICLESTWIEHVIGDLNHTYMEGSEEEIIEALQNPHNGLRCIDKFFDNRRVYYKENKSQGYFTKVVVEYEDDSGEGVGNIVTAYQPDSITPGEMPEWPK